MNTTNTTGLGEPVPSGKRSLFQPPIKEGKVNLPRAGETTQTDHFPAENLKPGKGVEPRVRTTIDLTHEALRIIQNIQQEYRFKTGKVLPLWKAVSQAIEHKRDKNRNGV